MERPEAGLAHARRAHEAEERALHLVLELAHGEVLDDALLDLLQAVVVLVEDLLGLLEVQVVLGGLAPGQGDHPVQPVAERRRLRGVGVHALQLLELALHLLQHRLGHLRLARLFAELRDLLRRARCPPRARSGSPSSAGAGRTRAGVRSISPLAWEEISCCMVRTSSSLAMSSCTRRSRSTGSTDSRISCAPSTFRSRLLAVRSASRPGSSMLVAITITSAEMGLPRLVDFSRAALTFRIRASSSSEPLSFTSGSVIVSIRAWRWGSPSS